MQTLASPKLAVVLQPAPTLETFASIGRGFHSNDARGTTTRIDPRSGDPVVPVQVLAPTLGSELGLRWAPVPGVVASVAAWRRKVGSELVFVGDAGITEPSRASLLKGIEVSARWLAMPWLASDTDLSSSRTRFSDADPAGPYVPGSVSRVASLGVTFHQLDPWSALLHVRHIGPLPLIENNSVRSGSLTVADLRIGYRITPRVDLLLDVFNLADRAANDIEYFYRSRLAGEPAAGFEDCHVHPAEPRTIRLSQRMGF